MAMLQLPFFDVNSIAPFIRMLSIIMLPIGVLMLLYGYKLFKFFLAFIGFVFGFLIGFVVGSFTGEPIIPGLLGGLLCALLFYVLYKIGIFVLGMIIGVFIGGLLMMISNAAEPAIIIIFAITGGIFALILEKFLIILFSSYQGASIVVSGLGWIFYPEYFFRSFALMTRDLNAYTNFSATIFLLTLILMIIGILYQYQAIPNRLDKHMPDFVKNKVADDPDESPGFDNKFEKKPQYDEVRNEVPISAYSHIKVPTDNNFENKITEINPSSGTFDSVQKSVFPSQRNQKDISIQNLKPYSQGNSSYNHEIISPVSVNNQYLTDIKESTNVTDFPFQLEVLTGPQQGHVLLIKGLHNGKYFTSTIGREISDSKNHIHISDPHHHVSRYHGEFAYRDQVCYVRSLSQTNPLLLNDNELNKTVFEPIQNHDILKMGNIHLRVILQ